MKSQVKKLRNLEPKKKSLEEAWKQLSSQYSFKKICGSLIALLAKLGSDSKPKMRPEFTCFHLLFITAR